MKTIVPILVLIISFYGICFFIPKMKKTKKTKQDIYFFIAMFHVVLGIFATYDIFSRI